MVKLFINPYEICKIKILGFRNTGWRKRDATPKTRFLLFWVLDKGQPAGWYDSYDYISRNYSLEEVLTGDSDRVLKDNKIMYKPMVFLSYKTNKDTQFTFDTTEEAEKFVQGLISKYNLTLELVKNY